MSHQAHHQPISKIVEYSLFGLLILHPLLFFPLTQSAFDTPKLLLLSFITFVVFVAWSVKNVLSKSLSFSLHPFVLPAILNIVAIAVSTILNQQYLIEVLPSIYGVSIILLGLMLIGTSLLRSSKTEVFLDVAQALTIILSLVSFLQLFGVGPTLILNSVFSLPFADKFQFTPVGAPLVTLSVLLSLQIPIIADLLIKKDFKANIFRIVGSVIVLGSICTHLFLMFPGKPDSPVLLPFGANWEVAIDTFKSPVRALFGAGPTSFVDAFMIFRPVGLNSTPTWNVVFQTGSNAPLTHAVTLGAAGVAVWIFFLSQTIRTLRKTPRAHVALGLIVLTSLLIQILLPLNSVLLMIQVIATIFWMAALKESQIVRDVTLGNHDHHSSNAQLFTGISLATAFGLLGVGSMFGYLILRSVVAEYYFFQSTKAIQSNKGNEAYIAQQKTVQWNPYKDAYRRTYAQTNFALANSISQKENITEEERNSVARLIQQAIREGRLAAQLNPRRAENWKILAQVYRSLLGSVADADRFTLASYVRAIQTAPTDPGLRVDLGGVYMQAKNYQQAATLFQQAVQMKPDFANGYYNWAKSLEQLQRFDLAYAAYQKALENLEPASDNYIQVQQDMTAIEEKAKKQTEDLKKAQEAQVKAQQQNPTKTQTEATPEATRPDEVPEEPEEAKLPEEIEKKSEDVKTDEELEVSTSTQSGQTNDAPVTPTP